MTCRTFPATIATRFVPAALLALLASGCVSMAPEYNRPAQPVPATYSAPGPEAKAADAAAAAEIGWRTYFPDPTLQTLKFAYRCLDSLVYKLNRTRSRKKG